MAVMRIAALLAVCLVGPFVVVVAANPMATEYASQTVDLELYDRDPDENDGNDSSETEAPTTKATQLDPWSLVWYIGSFGGLVAFFLAVSCSECCCHRPSTAPAPVNGAPGSGDADAVVDLPPPPPYSLFAPPPYDSLVYAAPLQEKDRLAVFVVPVPVHGVVSHPP